jgi:UDP-N-acetylmuramate dehydrogenase
VERLAEVLRADLGHNAVQENHPLARYTAIRIGGPADLLVVAESVEALQRAVKLAWAHGIACHVLGGGSNVLVSDRGVRGLVVLNRARGITFSASREPETGRQPGVRAESGASISTVARKCVDRGLAGLEWATGIPGTVGGAVVGNAGAWGGEVASNLTRATVLEPDGQTMDWPVERLEYGYRTSLLKQSRAGDRQAVVLAAEFVLREGERETLESQVAEITSRRKASQPAGATCGSVFQNPAEDYAGRLIEAAGLKGRHVGGAEISEVHANFVLNRGDAKATEVMALIELARQQVQVRFGVTLELEIELVGDW